LYVLDEPHILSSSMLSAVQTLLIEHEHATGQQMLIAIFERLNGQTPKDRTAQVFQTWAIGSRSKDEGVLLALYWKEREAWIEAGYGLEDQLTETRSQNILSGFLMPELQAGKPNRAIPLALYQVLAMIDSPLIANGLADKVLRGQGGFRGSWTEVSSAPLKYIWLGWLTLGLLFMGIVGYVLTSADAHFTRNGWFRPRPWRQGKSGFPKNGGGAHACW
jgi:uncharacterized membrane protein YgcG